MARLLAARLIDPMRQQHKKIKSRKGGSDSPLRVLTIPIADDCYSPDAMPPRIGGETGMRCALYIACRSDRPKANMSTIQRPRTAHHPDLGQLILLHGISTHAVENLLQSSALRSVLHDGHQYVVRSELEAYGQTDIEDLIDLDAVVEINEHTAPDRLHEAVQMQADADEYIAPSRSRLVQRVEEYLQRDPTTNPFARPLGWPSIWDDAVHIAVNMAGDLEASRIAQAYQNIVTTSGGGNIDAEAFIQFHRTLLSLAAPELDDRFPEIWQPGYGLLPVPSDVASRTMVLAVLRRLVALFSGYRGNPEGSETPSQLMGDYLALVQTGMQG